jgi:hypothetical protein
MSSAYRGARSDASFQPCGKSARPCGSKTSVFAGPVAPKPVNAVIEKTVSLP